MAAAPAESVVELSGLGGSSLENYEGGAAIISRDEKFCHSVCQQMENYQAGVVIINHNKKFCNSVGQQELTSEMKRTDPIY